MCVDECVSTCFIVNVCGHSATWSYCDLVANMFLVMHTIQHTIHYSNNKHLHPPTQSRGSGSAHSAHRRKRDRIKAKAQRFAKNISKWSSHGHYGEQKTIPMLTLPSGCAGTLRIANRGESPVLFRLVQAQYWSGFDRCITVWPARGYVAPHSTATLRVSGVEARHPKHVGTLRSAFEVLVTGEYSVGGEMAPQVLRFAVQLEAGVGGPQERGVDGDSDGW